jgi:hypothetical protein
MKITKQQLRNIIKEEVQKVLAEGLMPGDKVDSNDKFDMLKRGDAIKINGRSCTILDVDHTLAELVYVPAGKSVRQTIDYRSAIAWEPDELPETDIEWVGPGAAPDRTRLPARKKSPFDYSPYD